MGSSLNRSSITSTVFGESRSPDKAVIGLRGGFIFPPAILNRNSSFYFVGSPITRRLYWFRNGFCSFRFPASPRSVPSKIFLKFFEQLELYYVLSKQTDSITF